MSVNNVNVVNRTGIMHGNELSLLSIAFLKNSLVSNMLNNSGLLKFW